MPLQAPVTHIVISEFRTRGPTDPSPALGEGTDEFLELFNPSSAPLSLSGLYIWVSSCGGGAVPAPVSLPAVSLSPGAHYRIGGASYSGSVMPDLPGQDLRLFDDGGIALRQGPTDPTTTVDAVGFCLVNQSDFFEVNPLPT